MPVPPPPVQLAAGLARAKAEGHSFRHAWAIELSLVRWPSETEQRREWKEVLNATRGRWEAAYRDEPDPGAESALRIARVLDVDGEPEPARNALSELMAA